MSVFFTDTDCEMHYSDADALNIKVIGMPYTIKGQEHIYDFGRTINIKEFYNEMREGEIVTTSALNSQDYIDYFENIALETIKNEGFDYNVKITVQKEYFNSKKFSYRSGN